MSHYEIVDKLRLLLNKGLIDDEPKALYLLVELRKVLDHSYDRRADYIILRFYCDWVVHTEKSRNLVYIAPIVKKIYESIRYKIEQNPYEDTDKRSPIVEFIYMDELKSDMQDLFNKEDLPDELFQKDRWVIFIGSLVQVLTNQPILNPIPEVPRLMITPSNPGCICGIMDFDQPIISFDRKEYTYYDFKNAY